MTQMKNLFLILLLAGGVGLLAWMVFADDEPEDNQLCNEVKHELDIQVRESMFPAERAEQVYQRCIKFYGDSK